MYYPKVFEQHIVKPLAWIKYIMLKWSYYVTPGAVMNTASYCERYRDLMVLDVGGLTDVHSVAEDSEEVSKILIAPEPESKRTVEGIRGF